MTPAIVSVAPKLGKLIPLLASDKPGEVLGAVAAIRRTLEREGLDLHDLAKVLGRAEPPDTVGPLAWRDIPESERAAWLAQMRGSRLLSPWERSFCSSILEQSRFRPWQRLSPKQIAILDRCILKITAEARW